MSRDLKHHILQVNEAFVLDKSEYFVDVQLWPLTNRLNPKRWLNNFLPEELPYAISLLNAFLYFPRNLTDHLLIGGFSALSRSFCSSGDSFLGAQARWRSFFDGVIVTCVRGEEPNPTDSGFTFLRMARQVLGIPEERILEPDEALKRLLQQKNSSIVFLDDFVGSGNQFVTTWQRQVSVENHGPTSFEKLSSLLRNSQFFYCPLVCTSYGTQRILRVCPTVHLCPSHVLSDDYSAFSPNSVIWPSELRESAESFIETTSMRAGIKEWRGFHELGLALAFEHSVPDATLPLLYWNSETWKPLIERT